MPVFPVSDVIIPKETAICITGHRERSIAPYRGDPELRAATVMAVKLVLSRYINVVMDKGYTTMINGLAEGADLWAADYCLKRKRFAKTKLIGVLPFLRHADFMREENLDILRRVERFADGLVTTCDVPNMRYSPIATPYTSPTLYQNRNYYMVDNCSAVVAFFSGSSRSGTAQTIRYAQRRNKPIFSFGIRDVYAIMDEVGTEKNAIIQKLDDIRFAVPKPEPSPSIIPQWQNISRGNSNKIIF
ncbi:MAG: DUF1273 family protein [Ruminococcus sp.]|nr:DUF1273 family protein [Ruminococcus sp.]